MARRFDDRYEAGRQLAGHLTAYADRPDVLVLGLPRAGLPVAFEVAKALHAPLDIFLARKLGVPGQEDLAMGAIAPEGVIVLNEKIVRGLRIPKRVIAAAVANQQQELARREHRYRGDRPAPDVRGRVVILVDDGLATGATMRAAAIALRKQKPARIVVAVPVAAPGVGDELQEEVDEIICAFTPNPFYAVGFWYKNFAPTTEQEVLNLLKQTLFQ